MECKDKPFNIKYTFSLNSYYELWQAKYNLVQLYNNIKKYEIGSIMIALIL